MGLAAHARHAMTVAGVRDMDRRTFITGVMAAGLAVATQADAASVFASTPLAGNRIAARFQPMPDGAFAPEVLLEGDDGKHRFSELTGKVHLVALWAEWCAPCLVEAGDLAVLQQTFGGPAFAIQSILTASQKKLDLKGARKTLKKTHGDSLPLWIEAEGKDFLAANLSKTASSPYSLPCVVLVDRHGKIRGRMIGLGFNTDNVDPTNHKQIMGLGGQTEWSTPEAADFIKALIAGALD